MACGALRYRLQQPPVITQLGILSVLTGVSIWRGGGGGGVLFIVLKKKGINLFLPETVLARGVVAYPVNYGNFFNLGILQYCSA